MISCLALFIALGGLAVAAGLPKNSVGAKQLKKNSVTAAKIKNGAVTGAKIKLSSLGTVPSATNATNATTAANAEKLGGVAASSYAKNQLESLHVIGAAGQPPFLGGCTAEGGFQAAAFYKDPFGVVHLLGDIQSCAESSSMFVLPAGGR